MRPPTKPRGHDLAADLLGLKEKLLSMGIYAERAVMQAVKSLQERDDELAAQVEAEDAILDAYEKDTDEICIRLLARATEAADVRFITVAMKIARDLERVGDEATTIARRARQLNQEPRLPPVVDIPGLAALALAMLKDSLDAFLNRKPDQARAVIPRDKEVDARHKQLQRGLTAGMMKSPETIGRGLNLMVVSKCLERIADHAANIAEEVVFLCEARDIRHPAAASL